jgi:hypothetical protein
MKSRDSGTASGSAITASAPRVQHGCAPLRISGALGRHRWGPGKCCGGAGAPFQGRRAPCRFVAGCRAPLPRPKGAHAPARAAALASGARGPRVGPRQIEARPVVGGECGYFGELLGRRCRHCRGGRGRSARGRSSVFAVAALARRRGGGRPGRGGWGPGRAVAGAAAARRGRRGPGARPLGLPGRGGWGRGEGRRQGAPRPGAPAARARAARALRGGPRRAARGRGARPRGGRRPAAPRRPCAARAAGCSGAARPNCPDARRDRVHAPNRAAAARQGRAPRPAGGGQPFRRPGMATPGRAKSAGGGRVTASPHRYALL